MRKLEQHQKKQQESRRPAQTVSELVEKIRAMGGHEQGFQDFARAFNADFGLQYIRLLFSGKKQTMNNNVFALSVYLNHLKNGQK